MNDCDFAYWKELPNVKILIEQLTKCYRSGSYDYPDPSHEEQQNFSFVTKKYFENIKKQFPDLPKKLHGVYLICKKEKPSEILYIGKAGTFDNNKKKYKSQDLPKRLSNRNSTIMSRNEWIDSLYSAYGTLCIKYILFFDYKKDPTPGFIESILLQSYLKEKLNLPPENGTF